MIELTEPQQNAIDRSNGRPVNVVDPRTNEQFVIVRADALGKLGLAPCEDFPIEEAYPLMDEVARAAGWDDPEWDDYDVYAKDKRP